MPTSTELRVLGPGISGRSKAISAQKRLNLYMEVRRDEDKSDLVAFGTPGLRPFVDFGNQPARGLWWFEAINTLFAVSYDRLLEIRGDGSYTERGVLNSKTGNVSMADNGLQLMIVDGANGYIYTPATAELAYTKPETLSRSYSQSGTTVTVTEPQSYITLARTAGDTVTVSNGTGGLVSGTYTIASVVTSTTWTYTAPDSATRTGTADISNNNVVSVTETLQTRATGQTVTIATQTGDLPSGDYVITVPVTAAPDIIATGEYVITEVGTSDFTLIGAELNEVGIVFTATGSTSGTGQVANANSWVFKENTAPLGSSGNLEVINNFRNITSAYTGVNFPGANTVAFIDSYFVINDPGTKQFWLSGQYDGFYWDPLQFASKEAYTDQLEAVTVDNGNIVLLGTISQEYWQNNGGFPFPFARISGSPTDVGLAARWSMARCGGMLFYLGRTRRGGISVFNVQNYTPTVVSTPDLDYLFSQYETVSDAVAFGYRQNGHEFYQISFPSVAKTWLYDANTQAWSELASGNVGRHYAQWGAQFKNEIVVSDYRNGKLYKLDTDYYTDAGDAIVRELITPHTFSNSTFNRLHIYRLRLDMEQGSGLTNIGSLETYTALGVSADSALLTESGNIIVIESSTVPEYEDTHPRIMLQVSRDGGYTYGNEMWIKMGAIGQYLRRAEWRRLGVSRSYVFKFRITDPVKVVIIGAAAYITQAAK